MTPSTDVRRPHRAADRPPAGRAPRRDPGRVPWPGDDRPGSRPPGGRTSRSIVARRRGRPRPRRAVFTPNAFAAAPVRLSQAHLAAEPGRRTAATAIISTSGSRERGDRRGGDADQAEVARAASRRRSGRRSTPTLCLSTGIIGTRLPLDRVAAGDRAGSSPAAGRRRTTALAAAAEALRTTDSRAEGRDDRRRCPIPTGWRSAVRVTRHRQGRRDDPSADGDDALGRADRRDRRARDPPGAAPRRRRAGRGTSSASTATRARTTRCSCSRPGAAGTAEVAPGSRGRGDARCARSRRSPATSPASRRPTARARRR